VSVSVPENFDPTAPKAILSFRNGRKDSAECSVLDIGNGKIMLSYSIDLHFGDSYTIYSNPFALI